MPLTVRKVLHVIPSVGPLRGGPSAMVRQLAGSLARAGIDTHVATTNDNGTDTLSVACGAPVAQDGATFWYFPRQLRFYTCSWPLGSWLADHVADFDLVHIHALFSYASLPASYWAHQRGIPYIVRPLGTLNAWGMTHRRPWLKQASFRLLERRIVDRAALMHYTSEQERDEAESLGITTASAVIPNALPDAAPARAAGAFRRRVPQLLGRPVILFLSRVDEKKGLDLLLRAFAELRRRLPDAALVIAGDGPVNFMKTIRRLADDLGVADAVVWTGFLSGDDKQDIMADADVFALPSYSENFGIAVAEAMAARLPVVVSDQVGIHSEISDAEAGLVVPCAVAPLTEALMTLLTDSARRAAMGKRGAALARERYSSVAVTQQLIAAYNTVGRVPECRS